MAGLWSSSTKRFPENLEVRRKSHGGLYDVIVRGCSSFIEDRLCSTTGERLFSFLDLGIRNNTTSVDWRTTPLCTSVVNSEFIYGVRASVIPNYS